MSTNTSRRMGRITPTSIVSSIRSGYGVVWLPSLSSKTPKRDASKTRLTRPAGPSSGDRIATLAQSYANHDYSTCASCAGCRGKSQREENGVQDGAEMAGLFLKYSWHESVDGRRVRSACQSQQASQIRICATNLEPQQRPRPIHTKYERGYRGSTRKIQGCYWSTAVLDRVGRILLDWACNWLRYQYPQGLQPEGGEAALLLLRRKIISSL